MTTKNWIEKAKLYVKDKCSVACDDFHAHSFDCLHFDTDEAAMIEALLDDNDRLRNKLFSIKKLTNEND